MKVILRIESNRDGAAEAKSLHFLMNGDETVDLNFNGCIVWPNDFAKILAAKGEPLDIVVQA